MIDYRDDSKASTGNFELIYRQMIPPAPSYLGLNLCLKGTQLLSKSSTNGKDKVSKYDPIRCRNDRKRLDKKPSSYTLSPKSLDFDNKENHYYSIETLASPRKPGPPNGALNKIGAMYKSVDHIPQPLTSRSVGKVAFPKYPNRYETSLTIGQLLDSSRRHKSCGPRLVSMNGRCDDIKSEQLCLMDNELERLECVGNRYGPDNDDLFNGHGYSDLSARKQSLDTPRSLNAPRKLRPMNRLPKPCVTIAQNVTLAANKQAKTKVGSIDTSKYRRYLTPKCLRSKSSVSLVSNIPYYEVNSCLVNGGLSPRTWHTKTGRLKSNGVKIEVPPIRSNGLKQ